MDSMTLSSPAVLVENLHIVYTGKISTQHYPHANASLHGDNSTSLLDLFLQVFCLCFSRCFLDGKRGALNRLLGIHQAHTSQVFYSFQDRHLLIGRKRLKDDIELSL